jgi:hypothetical protein
MPARQPTRSTGASAARLLNPGIPAHLSLEGRPRMADVIATESTIVHDPVLDIDRQIMAGQPVPPDLIDAYKAKVGDKAAEQDPGEAARDTEGDRRGAALGTGTSTGVAPDSPADYESMSVEDLKAEADRRGLTAEGTGKDGNVLKTDLVKALQADDRR